MSPKVKSGIKYSFLVLSAYLVFLVATMPAGVAYGYWKQKFGGDKVPVVLSDIDGTVWSGKVGKAVVKGNEFNALNWDVHFLTLLLGIMELDFELTVTDGFAKGTAGYSVFGGTYLNNIEAWNPLSQRENIVSLGAIALVDLDLPSVIGFNADVLKA